LICGAISGFTYAYALEQLEADFITKVVNASGFNTNFTAEDKLVLIDLYQQSFTEFLKPHNKAPNPSTQLLGVIL
jgi:hypothetical protein